MLTRLARAWRRYLPVSVYLYRGRQRQRLPAFVTAERSLTEPQHLMLWAARHVSRQWQTAARRTGRRRDWTTARSPLAPVQVHRAGLLEATASENTSRW